MLVVLHIQLVLKLHVGESHYNDGGASRTSALLGAKAFCSIEMILGKYMYYDNTKIVLQVLEKTKEVYKVLWAVRKAGR